MAAPGHDRTSEPRRAPAAFPAVLATESADQAWSPLNSTLGIADGKARDMLAMPVGSW